MERLLEGSEGDEDISKYKDINLACLDKQLQYGKANQDNKKESLEKKNSRSKFQARVPTGHYLTLGSLENTFKENSKLN